MCSNSIPSWRTNQRRDLALLTRRTLFVIGNVVGKNVTSSIISGFLLGFRAGELRWTKGVAGILGMGTVGSVVPSPRPTRYGVEVGRA
jgi:hypothetical protein